MNRCNLSLSVTLVLLFFSFNTRTQDQIVTLDNDTISVEILELSLYKVSYKLLEEDTTKYKIKIKDLAQIIFVENEIPALVTTDNETPTIYYSKKRKRYIIDKVKVVSSFWKLEEYLIHDILAESLYLKAKVERQKSNFLVLGSVVNLCAGYLIVNNLKGNDPDRSNFKLNIGRVLLYIVSPIMGAYAINKKSKLKRTKKKVMDAFGIKYISKAHSNNKLDIVKCNIGVTGTGVGMVIQF